MGMIRHRAKLMPREQIVSTTVRTPSNPCGDSLRIRTPSRRMCCYLLGMMSGRGGNPSLVGKREHHFAFGMPDENQPNGEQLGWLIG